MLGDIIDYDQSVTGEDNSATYYAFFTFIRKVFEGIGGGVGLFIAAKYGFDPGNLVINDDVIFSMQLVMGYLPGVIFIGAAIASYMSPITAEKHKEILAKIESKKTN
jgi:Na+/melibiose symporter-like transporter